MQRFKFSRFSTLAIAIVVSIAVMILNGLVSPVLPTDGPQTKLFDQVWETVNDKFFDPNFNGVDWPAMRQQYRPQAEQAQTVEEVAVVINQMLSELKTSHTRFYTPDEPAYYQLLGIFQPRNPNFQQEIKKFLPGGKLDYSGIGIFTKDINGQTFVSGVLEGSPAAESGLKVGDRVVSVEGQPFQPIQSFKGKVGQKVTLAIQRSNEAGAAPVNLQEIAVTPKVLDATTMFLDAQQASTQVMEREGHKIGYVHIWSYAGDQYQQQLEEDLLYGRLKDTDGFVLDLREGWGGAPLTATNIYTAQNLSLTSVPRSRQRDILNSSWKKPVVMLVNEGSRSAKEILAYGFQQYNIGPVVGAKTAGAVVAGSPFLMQDGNLLYLAVADVYMNGNQRLEGAGVTPDVVVPFSLPYAQGADPQKERAIDVALEAVKRGR